MQQRNELNRKLASLLGWTHFEAAGGALLGSPPWWAGNSRGQAQVPDWEGDWRPAGALMAKYHCSLRLRRCPQRGDVIASEIFPLILPLAAVVSQHNCLDAAYRVAIIVAVIAKLESRKG